MRYSRYQSTSLSPPAETLSGSEGLAHETSDAGAVVLTGLLDLEGLALDRRDDVAHVGDGVGAAAKLAARLVLVDDFGSPMQDVGHLAEDRQPTVAAVEAVIGEFTAFEGAEQTALEVACPRPRWSLDFLLDAEAPPSVRVEDAAMRLEILEDRP